MPSVPVPAFSGSDDAFMAIISELARVEEAARAAGVTAGSGGGAITATGRQLEGFIGYLDTQVSPFESAAQVYRELRGFLKEQAEDVVSEAKDVVRRSASEIMQSEAKPKPDGHSTSDEHVSEESTR
ncbi:MAG: hypothetical protein AAGF14_03310 [Pseudomonadota bacterium]